MSDVATTPLSLLDGHHRAGRPALPGCHALHPHELVLPDSVSNARALPRNPHPGPGGPMWPLLALAVPASKGGHRLPNTYCGRAQPRFKNYTSSPKIYGLNTDSTSPHQARHPYR